MVQNVHYKSIKAVDLSLAAMNKLLPTGYKLTQVMPRTIANLCARSQAILIFVLRLYHRFWKWKKKSSKSYSSKLTVRLNYLCLSQSDI